MTAMSAVPDRTPSLWHSTHLWWWSSAPWLREEGSEEDVGEQLSLETLNIRKKKREREGGEVLDCEQASNGWEKKNSLSLPLHCAETKGKSR